MTCSTPPLECGPCPPGGQCDRETGFCLCGGSPCKQQAAAAKKGPAGPGGPKGGGGGLDLPGGFGGLGGRPGARGGQKGPGGGEDGLPDANDDLAPGGRPGPGKPDVKTLTFHPNCNAPTAGQWNASLEMCECNGDYYGDNCENQHCADFNETLGTPDCSGNGMCVQGKCFCAAGWGKAPGAVGVNVCKDPVCPVDCGPHGMCKENSCVCQDGWQGPACREPKCPNDCWGHGTCTFVYANSPAECQCDFGYSGSDCSGIALYQRMQSCPNACSGRGLCMNGKCVCSEGSSGTDCSGTVCPEGRSGDHCEQLSCPRDCMGYGMCFNGACSCDNDHTGLDCSIPMKCYDACYDICLPNLESPRCEFCKGQCLTALDGNSIGKHNPMLARLYSLADLSHPGAEKNTASGQNKTATAPLLQSRRPLLKTSASAPEMPHQRIRRKHKEVSAVQTSNHLPRVHREVSAVKVGSFRLR